MRQISKDVAAGALLIAIAGLASQQCASLELGTLRQIGPGMMPRALALVLGVLGLASVLKGYADKPVASPEGVARGQWWSLRQPLLRGPISLFVAVCLFGLSVRTLGFLVAGPLVVLFSGLATSETRWLENALFAFAMTGFCFLLFKQLLSLPIPVAPWVLGY